VVVQVLHVNTDGFGVCFHQHDGSLFRCVYKMLYEPLNKELPRTSDSNSDKYGDTGLPQIVRLNVVSGVSKCQ